MKRNATRLIAVLVVLLVALATGNAQLAGKRFAPKGTFKGNPTTLVAIGHSNPAIAAYYADRFGNGWDQPGALKVVGQPTDIPNGAAVPGNALIDKSGRVREMLTHQRGADRAWLVENTLTGMKMWVKSCGQGFSAEMPKNPPPAVLETDYDEYITLSATASAEAEATATATATCGNATVNFTAPQPLYIPQPRVIAQQGSERYVVAGIQWLPVTKIDNKNFQWQNQNQEQSQSQAQSQAQSQLQEILNQLGLGG